MRGEGKRDGMRGGRIVGEGLKGREGVHKKKEGKREVTAEG